MPGGFGSFNPFSPAAVRSLSSLEMRERKALSLCRLERVTVYYTKLTFKNYADYAPCLCIVVPRLLCYFYKKTAVDELCKVLILIFQYGLAIK